MDDPPAVGIVEGRRDLARDAEHVVEGQGRVGAQVTPQRSAGDERHDIVQAPVGFAGVEQRQDVRVVEAGGDLDLAEKALRADGRGQLGAQDLDRHLSPVLEVAGVKDGCHAAAAELALERVAIGQRCGRRIESLRHPWVRCRPRFGVASSSGGRRPPV